MNSLVPGAAEAPPISSSSPRPDGLVDSYRRLAEVFHDVLSEQSLDGPRPDRRHARRPHPLRLSDDLPRRRGRAPAPPRDRARPLGRPDHERPPVLGEGITGWAIDHDEPQLVNEAHHDPRVKPCPGTPDGEPEALISVPLVARSARQGRPQCLSPRQRAFFSEEEFELAKRFGDAAALALDNAQMRAGLELQAQTDSLTGLYNHRYFHDRLRSEMNRTSRTHDSIAVLMLDIDDFKRVNDVYGHGDRRRRARQAGRPAAGHRPGLRRRLPPRRRGVRGDHVLAQPGRRPWASPAGSSTRSARRDSTRRGG